MTQRTSKNAQSDPAGEPHASAEPPGQGSPDAAATAEAAAVPPASHAADPPPEAGSPAPPDGGTGAGAAAEDQPAAETSAGPGGDTTTAAAGGQVQGGRLADLGPRAMPPGVPYAVAREPLFVVNPEAAAAPVRAFNPGDRVPAELVEKFGWHDLTDIPEWASAPPASASPENTGSEE